MNIDEINNKMDDSIKHLEKELQTIRTSRASPSMLENIYVDAYGTKTPITQLGNVSTPDPSMLTIQVWDSNLLKNIENSILESNLGINPQIDGSLIRLPIPKLSEERRNELTKIAAQYAESSKISIRNNRRDFIESKKNEKKDSSISEDELKKILNEVQLITDDYISKIDKIIDINKNTHTKILRRGRIDCLSSFSFNESSTFLLFSNITSPKLSTIQLPL